MRALGRRPGGAAPRVEDGRSAGLGRLIATLAIAFTAMIASGVPQATAATSIECGVTYNCATLSVNAATAGSGETTSSYTMTDTFPARIDCTEVNGVLSGKCSLRFVWSISDTTTTIDFTETPALHFVACYAGPAGSCVSESHALTEGVFTSGGDVGSFAAVYRLATRTIAVSKSGDGTGTVEGPAMIPDIDCGSLCIAGYPYGTSLELDAKPDAGSVFNAWTGACAGQGAACHLTLDSAYPTISVATTAVFGLATASPAPTTRPKSTPRPSATPPASVPTPVASVPSPVASAGTPVGSSTPEPSETLPPTAGGPTAVPTPTLPVFPAGGTAAASAGIDSTLVLAAAIVIAGVAVGLGLALSRRRSSG